MEQAFNVVLTFFSTHTQFTPSQMKMINRINQSKLTKKIFH